MPISYYPFLDKSKESIEELGMIILDFTPVNLSWYPIEEEVIEKIMNVDNLDIHEALKIGDYLKENGLGGYKVTSTNKETKVRIHLNKVVNW